MTFVTLLGPSGAGKTEVARALLARHPDWVMPRGVWTRPYRAGETAETADSDVVSEERYHFLRAAGHLTADSQTHGYWYGTPLRAITEPLAAGKTVLRIFSVDGVDLVRRDLPTPLLTIFLWIPLVVVRERLERRGDDLLAIERRVRTAAYELTRADEWEYRIDATQTLARVIDTVDRILQERCP